ncbi:MAG: molybdopterin-binding protein [Rhodobacterales bacterium]|nr:molybdopterin-binding protein [Rhodobacterales bacterium]
MKTPIPDLTPPPLRDDCFALPAGVDWAPVDEALALLRGRLNVVAAVETCGLSDALGRVLAVDVMAQRSNPPTANTAVDGYGFAFASLGKGDQTLPLVEGRSAAGDEYKDVVPKGYAVRVLTGATIPDGVDTVVLQEDCTITDSDIIFAAGVRSGANTRRAGEDIVGGNVALAVGRRITAADLALMAAVGISTVQVRAKLRVAVVSTGDELAEVGEVARDGQIYDANRPMLLGIIEKLGFQGVDMGRVRDTRDALETCLNEAATRADVIITSGGASAGDEDHVSALLTESGAMEMWRIAIKPGRPLALAMWNGTPVFGLPGNPVAAMVTTLIFANPAMRLLAGEAWHDPVGYDMPAAFEKRKKPGRREYLRARIRDGKAEVFASEGSGRISGLSWAEGLVELGEDARDIAVGDLVRFIPYGSFGI